MLTSRTAYATLLALLTATACAAQDGDHVPTKDEVRDMGKADGGFDWCDALGWYGDGICDDFCVNRDGDCASDARTPELGGDPSVVLGSKIAMGDALAQVERDRGVNIEAKFELDDAGKLSLSVYPVGAAIAMDAERNVFQEAAGDPTATPFTPGLEAFHDQEHLTRSARDLTLVQLSSVTLRDAVASAAAYGTVYWAIPTIQEGRAGYGVYFLDDDGESEYAFIDGKGSSKRQTADLGTGPGSGATDARTPELGDDLSVLTTSRIKMSAALQQIQGMYGPAIEAKYEIGDDGKLSLSIYPVTDIELDSERNHFFELAGDPTAANFAPSLTEFTAPDEEHLTRSSRDLTLVQTSSLTLLAAVKKAESRFPGGFVYWAIPTLRGTRAGYGVYVRASNGAVHYLFIS